MLQIYVTLWGRWFVCACVCVRVYLELLSHFLPIKINLTNILPVSIKIVDFKNLAWATSFATQASGKFTYMPYRASRKKVIVIPCKQPMQSATCHAKSLTPVSYKFLCGKLQFAKVQHCFWQPYITFGLHCHCLWALKSQHLVCNIHYT